MQPATPVPNRRRPPRARAVVLCGLLLACATPLYAQSVYHALPTWSPDGRTISFESNRDGEPAVYTIHPDGTGLRRLTPPGIPGEQPNWSPDGSIVFTFRRNGSAQLYRMSSAGENVRPIPGTDSGFLAAFAPDGALLLFAAQDATPSSHYRVFVVRPDGSRRIELGDTSFSNEDPRWTTDGRIAFSTVPVLARDSDEAPRDFVRRRERARRWFTVLPDGSGLEQVAQNDVARITRDRGLSPDGRWLVLSKSDDGGSTLILRDVATGSERVLDRGR